MLPHELMYPMETVLCLELRGTSDLRLRVGLQNSDLNVQVHLSTLVPKL